MKIFDNLFGSKKLEGVSIDISKYDVNEMKDTEDISEKVQTDLQNTPEVVDRRVVMMHEKKFIERFKKLGNLHQKCPYCAQEYKSSHVGEKKCTACKHTFLVQKRVQDMGTVAYKLEQKPLFDAQWKATSKIKKFKYYLPHEYEYIEKQLQKQGKKHLSNSLVMHSVINAYAKNSISAGHYQLYAALMFHKAELMRLEQRFAEALIYYFYVYFLHTNGVDNQAGFQGSPVINSELREKISELLDLGNFQVKKLKDLFDYSIAHLNVFNLAKMNVTMHKSYSTLMKEFRLEDEAKMESKPMRSFVLYTKAS